MFVNNLLAPIQV